MKPQRIITERAAVKHPADEPHPAPRHIRRETCVVCHEPVYAQGRCRAHHDEYQAASARRHKRAAEVSS